MEGQTAAAVQAIKRGVRSKNIKSTTRGWPAGPLNQWTFRVLTQLSHHFPAAIERVAQIVADPEHKDNFAACKFVVESLIRDGTKVRGPVDGSGVTIKIEMAQTPPDKERVISGESEVVT